MTECDGCGWEEKIVYVNEFGEGYCQDCVDEGRRLSLVSSEGKESK